MPVTIFLSCQLQGCHYYQVFNSLNSNQQIFLSSNTRLFGIVEKMGPVALGNTLFRMDFSVVGRVAELRLPGENLKWAILVFPPSFNKER